MPELKCTLSTGVWELLQGHSQRAREPLGHIVNKALAAYFDVAHHTIYQVSTATALVEGIYQGAVRVGALREHGDHRIRLDLTAYGCFMMGPSATADVEATLVHGAQGVRSLNVFFLPMGATS